MAVPHFFRQIGSDRFLTPTPLAQVDPHPLLALAWEVYRQDFGEFTGSTLDPLFHRLSHPAARCGSLRIEQDASVLVVGTGPSLAAQVESLREVRHRFRIFTSPRGAEALLAHDIVPDLVVVEHQTALDAHHSQRHALDTGRDVLAACPLVAADWRTPAALLHGVAEEAVFVPSPLPTWGLWTATAVAMAVDAGAARVALLGVDLGTPRAVDHAHQPLAAVLALLARLAPVTALDCGAGAFKPGWVRASLRDAAGRPVRGRCEVTTYRAPSVRERQQESRAALECHGALIERARAALQVASDARLGRTSSNAIDLRRAAADMMAWREDESARIFAQEHLGLAFLPRLWRIGLAPELGDVLWRPVMLAAHELVRQVDALETACRMARAA